MSWIRLESGYHRHSKVFDFAEALGERTAGYYLAVLWGWVAESHEDGDVSSVSDKRLAEMADYRGDATLFCNALRQCGFLDEDGFIHNWERWQGAFVRKREKDRAAASVARTKIKDLRKVAATVAPTIAPTVAAMVEKTVAPTVEGTVVRAGRQAGRQALEEQVQEPSTAPTADAAVPAPESKPVQEPLIPEPPKAPRKQREPSTPAEIDGERWRKRAYEVQNVPYEKAGAWPKGLFLAFRRAWDDRGIDVLMQSLDGLSRLPSSDFNRKRGWTHWMAAECIDAGLAALNAPIASTATRGASASISRPEAKPPPPRPKWNIIDAVATAHGLAMMTGRKGKPCLVIPHGESLPEGFDTSPFEVKYAPPPHPRLQDLIPAGDA